MVRCVFGKIQIFIFFIIWHWLNYSNSTLLKWYTAWLSSQHIYGLFHTSLTHWGRVTHICLSKLIIIGSDNGLSPGRRQAIIWTNDGILLIGTLRTNFSEILIEIRTFSFKKMGLKVSSAKWRPFCLGLNVLNLTNRNHQRPTTLNLSEGNASVTSCKGQGPDSI